MINKPSFRKEKEYWNKGIQYIIGIDEVGRGAFAGPIVAAAVVFDPKVNKNLLCDINDSKQLKFQQRKKCAEVIRQNAKFFAIEHVEISYINKFGIGKANSAVFRKVLNKILTQIESSNYFILIDGFHRKYLPGGINRQEGIVKGDQKSLSIASASILAKVHRDNLMKRISYDFPEFKFAKNKGYGTKTHRQAIKIYGLTKIHRTSFSLQKFL